MAMRNGKMAALSVPEAPAKLMLRNPYDGEPIVRNDNSEECWIEFHPSQSKFGQNVDRRLMDDNIRLRNQGRRMNAREIQDNVCKKLAMLTTNWCLAMLDGTPVDEPCNVENAHFYYTEVEWLREAASSFVNDLGNFRPTPSESSVTSQSTSSDSTA